MYQSIATEIDGAVGILTLNRPARHNALDETLITEITTGLLALEAAASVRVVVLSSAGGTFCAGADMNWLRRETTNSLQENLRDARHLGRLMATLNNLSKPTIGRIQGPSFGSGVGLVACCDIAVATYDAQFALSDVKLGIIPAVVSPFIMAAIGERFVRRYTLSAERFSAAEAYRIGLVHEIVPDETQLDQALFEIVAREIAASLAIFELTGAAGNVTARRPTAASKTNNRTFRSLTISLFLPPRSSFEAERGAHTCIDWFCIGKVSPGALRT